MGMKKAGDSTAMHHPFTRQKIEDIPLLKPTDLSRSTMRNDLV